MHVTDEDDDDGKPSVVTSKHVTLEVQVPQHAVGAVIGLRGAQIKQVLCVEYNLCLIFGIGSVGFVIQKL